MSPCNYIPLQTFDTDSTSFYTDELLELDVLCTEEGIFINVVKEIET